MSLMTAFQDQGSKATAKGHFFDGGTNSFGGGSPENQNVYTKMLEVIISKVQAPIESND